MKCSKINAGMLRQTIVIERLASAPDGMGGVTKTWATLATVPAYVRSLTGTERWEAMRVTPGNLKRAVIRWRGDAYQAPYYRESDRVMYQDREHGIIAVMDIENSQQWLQVDIFESLPS